MDFLSAASYLSSSIKFGWDLLDHILKNFLYWILWMNGSQPYKCQTCRAGRTPAASHQGPASESEWFSCRKTLSDLFAALHALINVHIEKTPRNLPQLGVAILDRIFKMNNKSVSHSHLINLIDKFIPCKLFHSATHPIRHQICPTHYHETGKILKKQKIMFHNKTN